MKLFEKIFKRKSKIDRLASQKRGLKIQKQNIQDRMHEKNSALETKIKKLENKAFFLKEVADKQCVEIDRKLQKINRDIESEQIYVNSVADAEKETKR